MSDKLENNNDLNAENVDFKNIAENKFLDYSMYVIVDRALSDVRDGLKPVHRRILFAQNQLKNFYNKPFKKSARIVGDVIGKYHPHGDTAVYDSLVRMAQPFSLRANLIEGQGNFGSIDGDSAAAMRYTESRQSIFADSMFTDIDKETVKMIPNYDGSEMMPEIVPTRFPNLLINGSEGIAVGMASYIPTHNPMEVLSCVDYLLEKRLNGEEPSIDELMTIMPAPDFSTGGVVHGLSQMRDVWSSGRGKVKLRAKWFEEELENGRKALIINEIPYQVRKEKLVDKIVFLCNPNKEKSGKIEVEGVFDIRDESTKDIRIVIELKKDADPEIVFNSLLKNSSLQTSISYNATVLVNGVPKTIGLLEILNHFIEFRKEIITKRTIFLEDKAKKRMYFLEALYMALENLDDVISLIRNSENPSQAVDKLVDFLKIKEDQARFIIDMKLSRLTSSQKEDIANETAELRKKIDEYQEILNSESEILNIIKEESDEQSDVFANTRNTEYRTFFSYSKRLTDTNYDEILTDLASLTKEEECTIIYSNNGYIRRMPLSEMEIQNRGTRGKRSMTLKKDDFVVKSIPSHSHNQLLIVSEKGKVFALNAYEIPEVDSGRFIGNIIEIPEDEKILMIIPININESDKYLTMITKFGIVKKSPIDNYKNAFRKSGLIGISLKENDSVIFAGSCSKDDTIVAVNSSNLLIRFEADKLRSLPRTSVGVRAMKLNDDELIIGGATVDPKEESYLACITESGMIKITEMNEYKIQNRSGKGVKSFKESDRTGKLFKALVITDLNTDLVTTTKNGISNRISIDKINITKRNTSGVKLIKIDKNDRIADSFNSVKQESLAIIEESLDVIEE